MKSSFVFKNSASSTPGPPLAGLDLKATGKGASIGASVGTTVPVVGTAIGAGVGAVVGTLTSLFGGGGKTYSDCGSKQRQAEKIFQQYFTTDDARQLLQDAEQNVGPVTGYSITDLAFHYLGGDDCQVTTSIGRAWSHRVEALLQQRQQEAQQAEKQKNNTSNNASANTNQAALPKWVIPAALGIGTIGIITTIAS